MDAPPHTQRCLTQEELVKKQLTYELVRNQLWEQWRNEYLLSLRERKREIGSQADKVKVGDIVLFEDDLKPRLFWKLGKIIALKKSEDGIVRSVTLKTENGEITRPIVKLYPLEICYNEDTESGNTLQSQKTKQKAAVKALENIQNKS